jgi:hypothetical protein
MRSNSLETRLEANERLLTKPETVQKFTNVRAAKVDANIA